MPRRRAIEPSTIHEMVFSNGSQGGEGKAGEETGKSGLVAPKPGGYVPVVCDAECLLAMRREEVFCLRPRIEVALEGGNTNRSSSNSSSSNSSSSVAGGGSPAGKGKEGDDAYAMAGEDVSATDVIMRMGNENFESQVSYDPHIGRGVQYCRFFRNMLADTCPIAVSQVRVVVGLITSAVVFFSFFLLFFFCFAHHSSGNFFMCVSPRCTCPNHFLLRFKLRASIDRPQHLVTPSIIRMDHSQWTDGGPIFHGRGF